MSFRLFDLIEEVVEETIGSTFSNNEFFNEFVEVKNLNIGSKNVWIGVDLANGRDFCSAWRY